MDTYLEKLIPIFEELRSSSMLISGNPHPTMQKYDLMFLGEKFNTIYTNDLHACLANYFGIKIEYSKLNELVPSICNALSMKYEPMKEITDLNNPVPACYQIELW